MHAGIPGTYFDSLANSALSLQELIGGVVGGAASFIGGIISLVLAIFKLKDACRQRGTLC